MTEYEISLVRFCAGVGVKIFYGFTDDAIGIYHHYDKVMILSPELMYDSKYAELFTYVLTHETCHVTRELLNRTKIYNDIGLTYPEHGIIEELIVEKASVVLCDGIAKHQSKNTERYPQYNKDFLPLIKRESERIIEFLHRKGIK